MAKIGKVVRQSTKAKGNQARSVENMDKVDQMVKNQGEKDVGSPMLSLCPRCGSSEINVRRIDIPGFAPEVQVCGKCGFRSESSVEVSPIEYFEDVSEEEEVGESRIAEIERRLQKITIVPKNAKPMKQPKSSVKPKQKQGKSKKPNAGGYNPPKPVKGKKK